MTLLSGNWHTGHFVGSKLCAKDPARSGVTSSGCSRVDSLSFQVFDPCLLQLWLNNTPAVIDECIRTLQPIFISAGHVQCGKSSRRPYVGRECQDASEY